MVGDNTDHRQNSSCEQHSKANCKERKTKNSFSVGRVDLCSSFSFSHLKKFSVSLTTPTIGKLGYCHAQLTNDSTAIKNYLKAAELNFRRFDAYRSVGLIYAIGLNDKSKAIYYLNKCIKINPTSDEVKKLIGDIENTPKEVSL